MYTMATNPLIPSPEQKEIIRVSISEAARLFFNNPQTTHRAIPEQQTTYEVDAERYKINLESLVKWSQRKTTVKNKTEKHGIGQSVDKWKISNTLYSPSKKTIVKNEIPSQASIDVLSKPDDNESKN